jgi:hypothetical protein
LRRGVTCAEPLKRRKTRQCSPSIVWNESTAEMCESERPKSSGSAKQLKVFDIERTADNKSGVCEKRDSRCERRVIGEAHALETKTLREE